MTELWTVKSLIELGYFADNKEAINFYKAIGYNEDEVISYGKRLIEDWAIFSQSTYMVKIKNNEINGLFNLYYWVEVINEV